MKRIRSGKWAAAFLAAGLAALLISGCGSSAGKGELLHLAFNEGKGAEVSDSAGKQENAEVKYAFTHSAFMDPRDPQWRISGVEGGSLLFDGSSTSIAYTPEQLSVSGDAFSVSVWVAPRTFEWDDPNAAEQGNEHLTAIVSQYNKDKKQGFLLGYQRFGRLAFEVGTGDNWYTLWGDNLEKYKWTQVTAVFDGKSGNMALYVNGQKSAEKSIDAGCAIQAPERENLLIGKNSHAEQIAAGTYNMFSGQMDELKLYDRVLGGEEIAETAGVEGPEVVFDDIWLEKGLLNDDIYKTQYHGGPYEHWMNEPHAPVYYNGKYHLFYQANMTGTYWRNICWGHLVSDDMVNWKPVKEAITPTEGTVVPDGVWSGGAALDANGTPLLFFTAGNDSFAKDGLISNQNIGVAYPADVSDPELTDWVICDKLAIAQADGQGRAGEFRDPHIWKEGDTWCMLICSGSSETDGGSALLYTTNTLELKDDGTIDMDWQYKGPVYEMENQPATFGTSWELPIILPLTNEAGTKSKYIFMISPAPAGLADNKVYYFLGDFDLESGRFTPDPEFDNHPALLDYGSNVFTGPSALVDPVSGETYIFSIMQDQRNGAEEGSAGWAHCVGLARRIWLNDEGTDVMMSPIDALHDLEGNVLAEGENMTLEEANAALAAADSDMLYLRMTVDAGNAGRFGLYVKKGGTRDESSFAVNAANGTIEGNTRNRGSAASTSLVNGPLALEDGKLEFEMYIDRSLVEAFFNDTKAISMRCYGDAASQGLELFADGDITVESLYVAEMKSIYE